MLRFQYDVSNKKMCVFECEKLLNRYDISTDLTNWCINYLHNYIYKEITQLVKSRESVFIYVSDMDRNGRCIKLLQKCERIYDNPNWIVQYLDILNFDIEQIAPGSTSRYFKNFYLKRNSLIDTLRRFQNEKSMYLKMNTEKQTKICLFS